MSEAAPPNSSACLRPFAAVRPGPRILFQDPESGFWDDALRNRFSGGEPVGSSAHISRKARSSVAPGSAACPSNEQRQTRTGARGNERTAAAHDRPPSAYRAGRFAGSLCRRSGECPPRNCAPGAATLRQPDETRANDACGACARQRARSRAKPVSRPDLTRSAPPDRRPSSRDAPCLHCRGTTPRRSCAPA